MSTINEQKTDSFSDFFDLPVKPIESALPDKNQLFKEICFRVIRYQETDQDIDWLGTVKLETESIPVYKMLKYFLDRHRNLFMKEANSVLWDFYEVKTWMKNLLLESKK